MNVGVELRVVFHIREENNTIITTSDSPDQSVFGIPTDETVITGNEIVITMKKMNATFRGKMTSDSVIEGALTQGIEIPLQLKKTTGATQKTKTTKPQTPVPPFPYKSENITYKNSDGSIQFGATITIPEGKGPFPAVVIISGSGIQNRDGDMLGHSLYAVLADHLTRNGIAVLRYDERGIGESGGDFTNATTRDFANDATAAVNYLLSRPEVNKKKIGLIGHSEGGAIAPMIAAERNDIDFIVLLAGPGVPTLDLMAEQNEAIAKATGITDASAKEFRLLYKQVINSILSNPGDLKKTSDMLEEWAKGKDPVMLKQLNLASVDKRNGYALAMSNELKSEWMKYFLSIDPAINLQRLKCKVLALNGSKDIQVLPASNLAGIRSALQKSKSPLYEVKEIPGLNHLFQACKKCGLDEYSQLEETFSPVALQLISDWLNKNTR